MSTGGTVKINRVSSHLSTPHEFNIFLVARH